MPQEHLHPWLEWQALLGWIILLLVIAAAFGIYSHVQRQMKWNEVLRNARRWAASVGGKLLRVSEQPTAFDRNANMIARRYRVTFIDRSGAQCVAVLRCTVVDDLWVMEKLTREIPDDILDIPPPAEPDRSSEGHARRHRGKTANVPVIFAPERRRKRRRRSA